MFLLFLILTTAVETDVFTPFPGGFSIGVSSGFSAIATEEPGIYGAPEEQPLLPLVTRTYVLQGRAEIDDVVCGLEFDGEAVELGTPLPAAGTVRPTGSGQGGQRTVASVDVDGSSPLVSCRAQTIMNSFTMVTCAVNPWRYDHSLRTLELATGCELSFHWRQTDPPKELSRLQSEFLEYRMEIITGDHYSLPVGTDAQTDYLIITGEDFTDVMQPLITMLEQREFSVKLEAVEEIPASWPGADTQESIRSCISYYFENEGTSLVLLGGDEEVVPARDVYTECEGYIEFAPADLYYAALDGTWDGNGNGVYGEWEDDPDLYAEVVLGRLLFSTSEEADVLISKNLEYRDAAAGDWYRSAVLCGATLFPEQGYTAARGCELTAGYFPEAFELTKTYQVGTEDVPDTYFPVIYGGAGWNHYAGHGNDRGVYWDGGSPIMSVSRMYGFENAGRYGIHTSIGCHTGDFTDPGLNLVDTLLALPEGGAVACLFNSTWGWEGYWPEIGSSERLCVNSVKAVYHDKAACLGLAFTSARDQEVSMITGPYDRVMQSIIAYTGFMEPSLEVLGVTPDDPLPPLPFALDIRGPNPATSQIAFRVTGSSSMYDISIYDIAGRKVMTPFTVPVNSLYQMDTEALYPGVYFIRAESSGGSALTGRFVKLR